jgi:hypothetical protein
MTRRFHARATLATDYYATIPSFLSQTRRKGGTFKRKDVDFTSVDESWASVDLMSHLALRVYLCNYLHSTRIMLVTG